MLGVKETARRPNHRPEVAAHQLALGQYVQQIDEDPSGVFYGVLRVYGRGQWPHFVEDTTIHDWLSLARYNYDTLESRLCICVYLVNLTTEVTS